MLSKTRAFADDFKLMSAGATVGALACYQNVPQPAAHLCLIIATTFAITTFVVVMLTRKRP